MDPKPLPVKVPFLTSKGGSKLELSTPTWLSDSGVFLEMCNDKTLLHPFCDLRFTRFLQELPGISWKGLWLKGLGL